MRPPRATRHLMAIRPTPWCSQQVPAGSHGFPGNFGVQLVFCLNKITILVKYMGKKYGKNGKTMEKENIDVAHGTSGLKETVQYIGHEGVDCEAMRGWKMKLGAPKAIVELEKFLTWDLEMSKTKKRDCGKGQVVFFLLWCKCCSWKDAFQISPYFTQGFPFRLDFEDRCPQNVASISCRLTSRGCF